MPAEIEKRPKRRRGDSLDVFSLFSYDVSWKDGLGDDTTYIADLIWYVGLGSAFEIQIKTKTHLNRKTNRKTAVPEHSYGHIMDDLESTLGELKAMDLEPDTDTDEQQAGEDLHDDY